MDVTIRDMAYAHMQTVHAKIVELEQEVARLKEILAAGQEALEKEQNNEKLHADVANVE